MSVGTDDPVAPPQPANRALIELDLPGCGRATLRRLDWDCEFFGFECGVIEGLEAAEESPDRKAAIVSLLRGVLRLAGQSDYRHVIFRPALEDWDAVHAAEQAGLLLIDLGVDFVIELRDEPAALPSSIRRSRDEDLPSLRDLASSAFTYSRFGVDPAFTDEEVVAFHHQWVTNLHNGLAQAVLVSEEAGAVAGFVSCSVSAGQGRIPLIASGAGDLS